jgi:hypothetical protein
MNLVTVVSYILKNLDIDARGIGLGIYNLS